MKLPLSARLQQCCRYVRPGDIVADIGCDHGYLGIHLLRGHIALKVYASDINQGPLDCAFRNAHKFGVADKMTFYLSDGLQGVPRDFTVAVCAGMGADTIISVLENAPWIKDCSYRLILQCQSRRPQLRKYLSENGWYIQEETALQDGRFLYTIMDVVYAPEKAILTPGQWYFPPALLAEPNTMSAAYYDDVLFRLRREIAGKKDTVSSVLADALTQLEALKEAINDIR